MGKSPSFQFYAADFITDTQAWTNKQVGMYIRLLSHQWINGKIPRDYSKLSMILGLGENANSTFDADWKEIKHKFFPIQGDQDYSANIRLETARQQQMEWRENKYKAGVEGAKKRWGNAKKNSTPNSRPNGTPNGSAKKDVVPPSVKPKGFVRPTIEDVAAYCKERKNSVDPMKWLDHYTANGFKVGKNSMKDWKAAVHTWENNDKPNKPVGSNGFIVIDPDEFNKLSPAKQQEYLKQKDAHLNKEMD